MKNNKIHCNNFNMDGHLYLDSLTNVHIDFLKGTTISGNLNTLDLMSKEDQRFHITRDMIQARNDNNLIEEQKHFQKLLDRNLI